MSYNTIRALSDLTDKVEGMIRHGIVSEVQGSPARVKVRIAGGAETSWRRWYARAGFVTVWIPPIVGERVTLFCPSGKLENAQVLPGFFCADFDQPSENLNETGLFFDGGDSFTFDHSSRNGTFKSSGKFICDAAAEFLKPVEFKDEVEGRRSAAFDDDVSDGTRSMQGDRDRYNQHTHSNMGAAPPNPRQ